MTRVLVVSSVALTLDTFLLPHLRGMEERGWTVDIAASGVEASQAADHVGGAAVELGSARSVTSPRSLLGDLRKLRAAYSGVDLVVTHTPIASALVRLSAPRRVPVAYVVHGLHVHPGAGVLQRTLAGAVERMLSRRTAAFLTMNEHDRRWLTAHAGAAALVRPVNGVGIDVEGLRRRGAGRGGGSSDAVGRIVVVGELNANKSVDVAIRAFASARQQGALDVLDVLGDGPLRAELEELVRGLGLVESVRFHGWVVDVPERLAGALMLVTASRREGLPVSVMEAMALGVPVVGRNIRGVTDLLAGGRGVLVDAGRDEVQAFARAILEVADDAPLRESVARDAGRAIGAYDVDVVVAQHLAVFEELLA